MAQPNMSHMPEIMGWESFSHRHIATAKMFLYYALPLSVVPPAMIYYAGVTYGGRLLPALTVTQLQSIGIVFFIAELVMTFLVGFLVQRLADWVETKAAFEDCYKLAVVVATPLWLAPLFLFIPSFMLNLSIGAAALILSGMLIFYGVPPILKIEEKGHAMLLSSSILAVGMVAWAVMMYLTLLFWGFGTSL